MDDAPSPIALLDWQQTDVQGRAAAYGVGGAGPSVVFLHGWGLSGRTYRATLKRLLAHSLRVWAPALPGFGGTEPLEASTDGFAAYAAWVDAFLEAVEIDEPAVVMGHSFGGGVAIQTAHDFPDRARGLVLINSIGGGAWRRDGDVVRPMAQRPLWDWGLHFPRDALPFRQFRTVLPNILDDAITNMVRNPRAAWRTAEIARNADLSVELEVLQSRGLPVVVLWGERDELITRASYDAMCESLGAPTAVTVPGNHAWLLADPDAFGEVITNVLDIAQLHPAARQAG